MTSNTWSSRLHSGKGLSAQLTVLDELGYEPVSFLENTSLSIDSLEDVNVIISAEDENKFFDNILTKTEDSLIGLKLGEPFIPQRYGIFGFALISAETLRHALTLAIHFYKLTFTYFIFDFKVKGEFAEFSVTNPLFAKQEVIDLLNDREVSAIVVAIQAIIAEPLPLHQIHLPHDGHGKMQAYKDYFNCEVLFNQAKAKVVFSSSILDKKLENSDPQTSQFFHQQCQMLIAKLADHSLFVDQVRMIILSRPGYFPDIDYIAEKISISTRTLRRRLSDEGSSYRDILDEIRYKLAVEYLTETQLALAEVSYLLGYSEPGNFTHAFRRWSGQSPSDYRLNN